MGDYCLTGTVSVPGTGAQTQYRRGLSALRHPGKLRYNPGKFFQKACMKTIPPEAANAVNVEY
jgi:hypothetical protein